MSVRVRFAPSPTGPLHIGGVRTALYNYLFAKKNNGVFILRIEDTDMGRYVPGAEDYIVEALKWCGIDYQEGINVGGPFQPYRQSERKNIYKQYAEQLVNSGKAYYAFDTNDELNAIRKEYESRKDTFLYNFKVRNQLRNSLSLSNEETQKLLSLGVPYVIRIKIPENEEISLFDIIRDNVIVHSSQIDDKVLFKSDGMPTYHLANVVDDHLMEITHVIRGEEWLPSAPLHVLLYRYLGWEHSMPEFAHLPLLLKPEGNGKLSKRDGDRLGFPVFPLKWTAPDGEVSSGYRESGYLPDAFINILAFLGWNPGTTQEIFSLQELVDSFSLDKVGKHGAKFDPEKAKWFNHQYIIKKDDKQLALLFKAYLSHKSNINLDEDFLTNIASLFKERINLISDIWDKAHYMFVPPTDYEAKTVKNNWKDDSSALLIDFINELDNLPDCSFASVDLMINKFLDDRNIGKGKLMPLLRLSIIGSNQGPELSHIISLLGKIEIITRIKNAVSFLEKNN